MAVHGTIHQNLSTMPQTASVARMVPGAAVTRGHPRGKFHAAILDGRFWVGNEIAGGPEPGNWLWQAKHTLATRWNTLRSKDAHHVLIVGAGRRGQQIAACLRGYCVIEGFLDQHLPLGGNILGRVGDLGHIARSTFADEIIVAIPEQREWARWAIQEARRNHLDVKLVPDLLGFDPIVQQHGAEVPSITLHREPVPVHALFWKRVTDVVLSLLGLFLTLPLMIAIATAIKLDSPGPVLYRAPRVGRKGKTFRCYKFRTMIAEAERAKEVLRENNERRGPFFKMAKDPRVTRIGSFLRRYSLDELPQLWNALRGEMSLVGPRPHPLDDFQHYELGDFRRLDVTPGITGLWQVTARNDPSFQRNMALDLEYIEHWSWGYDMRILARTLSAVWSGSGT